MLVEVKGLKTFTYFDIIEIVDESSSYPTLLGIGWESDNLVVINFKKQVMTFENHNFQIIIPLDPMEGRRYVKPVKEEVARGWDHAYNNSEDYISPTTGGELDW